MIKSNELRIGNLVNFGNLTVPIKSIYTESVLEDNTSVYVKLNDRLSHYCLDVKDITPIPLTEEILLKCGLEKIENNWKVLAYNGVFYFSWERLAGSAFSLENKSIYLPHIKHLHQLQNLYFALTNEELEVKL